MTSGTVRSSVEQRPQAEHIGNATLADELTERPLQLRGSPLARWALQRLGWTVIFDGLPARQGVVVVYPHTSNWDFPLAMLTKWAVGIDLSFWGKDSLFRIPLFGRWLRWLGGIPVLRHTPQGVVGQMCERMQLAKSRDEYFWLGLSPEGTRTLTEGWRSGFYQVALQADVPLGLVFFDYAARQVGVRHFMRLSGEREVDMALIAARLQAHQGKYPERAAPIRLRA